MTSPSVWSGTPGSTPADGLGVPGDFYSDGTTVYVNVGGVWRQYTPAEPTLDSAGLSICRTVVPPAAAAVTIGTANSTWYYRVTEGAVISAVALYVVTPSGHIWVQVFRNNGLYGTAAAPGALAASSGLIPCPAAGVTSLPIGGRIAVARGDWLAVGCDNATATFCGSGGVGDLTLSAGLICTGAGGLPSGPNPAVGYSNNRMISLVGQL